MKLDRALAVWESVSNDTGKSALRRNAREVVAVNRPLWTHDNRHRWVVDPPGGLRLLFHECLQLSLERRVVHWRKRLHPIELDKIVETLLKALRAGAVE